MKKEEILAKLQMGELSVEEASKLLMESAPQRSQSTPRARKTSSQENRSKYARRWDYSQRRWVYEKRVRNPRPRTAAQQPKRPLLLPVVAATRIYEISSRYFKTVTLSRITEALPNARFDDCAQFQNWIRKEHGAGGTSAICSAARVFQEAIGIRHTPKSSILERGRNPLENDDANRLKRSATPRKANRRPLDEPRTTPSKSENPAPTAAPISTNPPDPEEIKVINCLTKHQELMGVRLLSVKTGIGESRLQKVLPQLIKRGLLEVVDGSTHRARYRLKTPQA